MLFMFDKYYINLEHLKATSSSFIKKKDLKNSNLIKIFI